MAFRKVPEPSYDKDVNKILKKYIRARELIIMELLRLVETGGDKTRVNQQASLLRQVDFIIKDLDGSVQTTIEEGILSNFKEGQAVLAYSVGDYKTLSEATENVAFSMLSRSTIDTILSDTFDDLLAATALTSKRTKRIVRRVVQEQMKNDMARARGRKIMKKGILEELTKQGLSKSIKEEGFVGIVDRKGRKWELNRYVDMVVRSKYKQARVEGMRIKALEEGYDLAVISTHGAKDACRNYEGMIISMNGTTPGYPTYSELRASNKIFHPNCKHTLYPIRSEEILTDEELRQSEKQLSNFKKS
ncbi:phage minor capsid protein [Bacillus haynesii]|uniref:phage minor capsid protein n=1 Tax=Bacillus haynesii TaxID=1925021 RepID=UPI00227FEBC2|nr:phage minor capsid protein [Bacillus haynesii]MCY9324067.1 phage minor capsid protein [Bacillus haynesii]